MESSQLMALGIKDTDQYENYWFIRSNKGRYYDDFVVNRYVAIGWDYITESQFRNSSEDTIKQIIENNLIEEYDDDDDDSSEYASSEQAKSTNRKVKNNTTGIYNKLDRFINAMQIGDLVLVPGFNSHEVSIGVIESDIYEEPNYIQVYKQKDPDTELTLCHYRKRRKVKWIKKLLRHNMDIYLTKAFSSQHALSNMQEYAPYIDRAIYPLYKKGNEIHATMHAGHPNGMSLSQLSNIIRTLEESIVDISTQVDQPLTAEDIKIKLNIHSPGIIELILACTFGGGVAASMIIHALNQYKNGGKSNISLKIDPANKIFEFSFGSEGQGSRAHALNEKQVTFQHDESIRRLAQGIEIDNELIDG